MIDPAKALEQRAAEVCRCRHVRAFHNPCSRCYCAWFLPRGEKDRLLVTAWTNDERARTAVEADPAPAPPAEPHDPDPNDGVTIPEIAARQRKAGK